MRLIKAKCYKCGYKTRSNTDFAMHMNRVHGWKGNFNPPKTNWLRTTFWIVIALLVVAILWITLFHATTLVDWIWF